MSDQEQNRQSIKPIIESSTLGDKTDSDTTTKLQEQKIIEGDKSNAVSGSSKGKGMDSQTETVKDVEEVVNTELEGENHSVRTESDVKVEPVTDTMENTTASVYSNEIDDNGVDKSNADDSHAEVTEAVEQDVDETETKDDDIDLNGKDHASSTAQDHNTLISDDNKNEEESVSIDHPSETSTTHGVSKEEDPTESTAQDQQEVIPSSDPPETNNPEQEDHTQENESEEETVDFDAQEKPTEPSSSLSQPHSDTQPLIQQEQQPPPNNPNALIQFHKIINDTIHITNITSYNENLYIGTSQGDIYHLIRIESDFILISKTSITSDNDITDSEEDHSISKIIVLPELSKLLVHSNHTLTFYNTQLQRVKNKQLHNVQDISLYGTDLTFFQNHTIRTFNSLDLKLKKRIDFEGVENGVMFERFALVASLMGKSESQGSVNYDLIDFKTFSKIPVVSAKDSNLSSFPHLIKVFPRSKLFLISFFDVTSMCVAVDHNGDIVSSINLESHPVDIHITNDDLIVISCQDKSVSVYYCLSDGFKLIHSLKRDDLVKFARVGDVGREVIRYSDVDSDEVKELVLHSHIALYNDWYLEGLEMNLIQWLVYLEDLRLVKAQIECYSSAENGEGEALVLKLLKQLQSLVLLENGVIPNEELELDLFYYVIGANEKLFMFELLRQKIETLKETISAGKNKLFQISLKNYVKFVLEKEKAETSLQMKLVFLKLFKDDFKTLSLNLPYLSSTTHNEEIVNFFQSHNHQQLLLLFYKQTSQPDRLIELYKQLINTTSNNDPIDPNFNKYDPQFLPYFQTDITVLRQINRLNLINTHDFQTDQLLNFVNDIETGQDVQLDEWFWEVCKKISVKQSKELSIKRLQKSLIRSELKRLK